MENSIFYSSAYVCLVFQFNETVTVYFVTKQKDTIIWAGVSETAAERR